MSNPENTIVISTTKIDPNQLRSYSKLPLPDFAIKALEDNGFTYNSISSNSGISEHNIQREGVKCKLKEHIQSIESHINKDGSRLWASCSHSNDRNELHSQSAGGDSHSN